MYLELGLRIGDDNGIDGGDSDRHCSCVLTYGRNAGHVHVQDVAVGVLDSHHLLRLHPTLGCAGRRCQPRPTLELLLRS